VGPCCGEVGMAADKEKMARIGAGEGVIEKGQMKKVA
jgi:hypothetical protein